MGSTPTKGTVQHKIKPDRASPNLIKIDQFFDTDTQTGIGGFAITSKLKGKAKPDYYCIDCKCKLGRKMKRCKPCAWEQHQRYHRKV